MSDDGRNTDRAVTILTTLHYVTQTQRMGTISESSGRASMFLSAASMALVALGFIAQATELSAAFYAFTFALLAVLLLIGLSTFARVAQLGAEDAALALENERIKAFYVETAPSLSDYVTRAGDGMASAAAPFRSRAQLMMTAAGMVALVNAALLGVGGALALARGAGLELATAAAAGTAAFVVGFALQMAYSRQMWTAGRQDETGQQPSRATAKGPPPE